MTAVLQVLETLDYVTATAVASPAAETAILSTDVINASIPPDLPQPGVPGGAVAGTTVRPVKIIVSLNITEGTSGTAFVVRCRQGVGVGGTLVGVALTVTLAAAASGQFTFVFRDSSGVPFAPAGTAYTITVAETAATVAGTVNAIDIEVQQ
jgi:hypothetical protein